MDKAQISHIASALNDATRNRKMLPKLSAQFPEATVEDAYAIQKEWVERQLDAGRKIAGHKIGLTSKAAQDHRGTTEPSYGAIFRDAIFDNSALIDIEQFHNPRVEVELAFVLGADLEGPNATIYDVLRATEFITPALEILTTHVEGPGRTLVDSVADNSYFGGMILGGQPLHPADVDLRWISALLYKNEAIEETGVAAGVLNHPATGIAWLANRFAEQDDHLVAGDIILAGSFTRPMHVDRGDVVVCDYGRMGTIAACFV